MRPRPDRRRLLTNQDNRLRRCWHCGEWAYDRDDCAACTAPHDNEQTTTDRRQQA